MLICKSCGRPCKLEVNDLSDDTEERIEFVSDCCWEEIEDGVYLNMIAVILEVKKEVLC